MVRNLFGLLSPMCVSSASMMSTQCLTCSLKLMVVSLI